MFIMLQVSLSSSGVFGLYDLAKSFIVVKALCFFKYYLFQECANIHAEFWVRYFPLVVQFILHNDVFDVLQYQCILCPYDITLPMMPCHDQASIEWFHTKCLGGTLIFSFGCHRVLQETNESLFVFQCIWDSLYNDQVNFILNLLVSIFVQFSFPDPLFSNVVKYISFWLTIG